MALKGDHPLYLSNFVRGEYIRGYIYGLILLYTAVKEEDSVLDGTHIFLAENMHRHRRIQNAFVQTTQWLLKHESSSNVETYLERLAETMRHCLFRLDEEFPQRELDTLACEHGKLDFPKTTLREEHVIEMYKTALSEFSN
jgi:hypothetical protein